MQGPILGIDIGGTKLAAGLVSRDGQLLSYRRELTPPPHEAQAESLLAQVVGLARLAIGEVETEPVEVGVGCGGPMRWPEGIVSPLHIPAWRNFPLKDRIEEALRLPVVVDNDANALALGEALFGAGRGATSLLGMVVSTGVGGGIVSDGRIFHGATGNAGHIGHVIVAQEGAVCDCGAVGCLVAYASGSGIARRARLVLLDGQPSTLAALDPSELTAQEVATAAAQGDPLSVRLMTEAGEALGRAIASTANLFDLDRVVIGGSVTLAGELLFGPLRQEYRRRARLDFTRDLSIVPASLGPQSGVIGAAALALSE